MKKGDTVRTPRFLTVTIKEVYESREDATKFTFIEEWLNDTAIEQHNNAKHFLQFLEDIKPLTEGDVQIEQLIKVPSVFC